MVASRRAFLLGGGALGISSLSSEPAHATLVRGLSLELLVDRSQHVILLKPLDSRSHYVELGGRRCIVTDTRVRVEDAVAKATPSEGELLVRTLGGRVGSVGQLVHGQAELDLDRTCLAFLTAGPDGVHWFVGMAQGHYRLESFPAAEARLRASRNLPTFQDWHGSAVRRLSGQRLDAARGVIRQVASP